jgi:hypothetical protein
LWFCVYCHSGSLWFHPSGWTVQKLPFLKYPSASVALSAPGLHFDGTSKPMVYCIKLFMRRVGTLIRALCPVLFLKRSARSGTGAGRAMERWLCSVAERAVAKCSDVCPRRRKTHAVRFMFSPMPKGYNWLCRQISVGNKPPCHAGCCANGTKWSAAQRDSFYSP